MSYANQDFLELQYFFIGNCNKSATTFMQRMFSVNWQLIECIVKRCVGSAVSFELSILLSRMRGMFTKKGGKVVGKAFEFQ